jgi:hypothetical protein
MKQGLEDANSKLNTLVDRLNLPVVQEPSGSTFSLGTCPTTQVAQSLPFHVVPSLIPTSTDSTTGHLFRISQTNAPPPHVEHHPTRTITLAGQFKLSFTETDVPHAPSISFADDLDALNSMWDDTSSYWKGHSALIVNNFPVAISYWKQVYTSKNGKNWKPGQWKILKGRYFEWRVSM